MVLAEGLRSGARNIHRHPDSGRDCVKSLRSSYTGLYPKSGGLLPSLKTSTCTEKIDFQGGWKAGVLCGNMMFSQPPLRFEGRSLNVVFLDRGDWRNFSKNGPPRVLLHPGGPIWRRGGGPPRFPIIPGACRQPLILHVTLLSGHFCCKFWSRTTRISEAMKGV